MTVSIICSTYKEYCTGQLIGAINSVRRQSYLDWELIIVGDHTPAEAEIKKYLERLNDPRIRFKNLRERSGIASPGTIPKISGLESAKGDLLCFLDADNMFFPGHLEQAVRAFKKNPRIDLVYGDTLVRLHPRASRLKVPHYIWRKPDWSPRRTWLMFYSNFLDMSEPVFTKRAYQIAGGLDASHQSSDWILWQKMISTGCYNFYHSPHLGLVYHTTSLKHHLQYWLLMLAQNRGWKYQSNELQFIQKEMRRRLEKKHA